MKIVQEHWKCIGCGACTAVCPKCWEMDDEGFAKPIGGKKVSAKDGDVYELEVREAGCNSAAADGCPVKCIKIVK